MRYLSDKTRCTNCTLLPYTHLNGGLNGGPWSSETLYLQTKKKKTKRCNGYQNGAKK